MLEAHCGVPMAGAVLNALNYRLDGRTIAFIFQHGGAKLLIRTPNSPTPWRGARSPAAPDSDRGRMATVTSIG